MAYWGKPDIVEDYRLIDNAKDQELAALYVSKTAIDLYLPLRASEAVQCSCVSSETQEPNSLCYSCYATSVLGGYKQWGYNYIRVMSTDPLLLLNNVVLDQSIRAYKLVIAPGQLSGTISTGAYYVNAQYGKYVWDLKYINVDSGMITVSFSIDNATWYDISVVQTVLPAQYAGNIYFRFSLSKTNLTDIGPEFDSFRFKYPYLWEPWIYMSKARMSETKKFDKYGLTQSEQLPAYWTVMPDDVQLVDLSFVRVRNLTSTQGIYALQNFKYSWFNQRMLRQSFEGRRVNQDEIFNMVF